MARRGDVHTLTEVVDRIAEAGGDHEQIAVRDILHSVGERSYGPLLLVPSLLLVTPLSTIPGLPSLGAVVIALIAGHLVLGLRRIWLPGFILRQEIAQRRMERAVRFLRPVASFADRLIKPRLTFLTAPPFSQVIGATCIAIAVVMPPLEFIPMANTTTASVVALFALSLVARDGFLVMLAYAAIGVGIFVGSNLLPLW